MSESGGHGASSLEEVSTALLLASSAFERKPGEDLDVADMLKPHSTAVFCFHPVLMVKTPGKLRLKYLERWQDESYQARGSQGGGLGFLP